MTMTYAGFLSYAHADEVVSVRLHKALETYPIPKGQTGTLTPIFRDMAELTAHHSLSEKIKTAVTGSRFLIVLCSPAAKASHWVNEEIRLFRKIHGEAAILCVLAEGTPDTAFPPALLEAGREPLAASLGSTRESFRLGVTQIAAAMLGVGLDTLIQRDARRKRRRLQGVTAAALLFSSVMGATTYSAVNARTAAEESRMEAEGLVEYLITDLKEKLEPVGRLDILSGIGTRAVEYYDAQDIDDLSDDSLARQARARHILGQVALDAYDYTGALREIEAATSLTQEVYDRNPEDTEAIFAHAQSEYWVGEAYVQKRNFTAAMPHWQAYSDLAGMLYAEDPENISWRMERGWGANNLALLYNKIKQFDNAQLKYLEAMTYFEDISSDPKYGFQANEELANILGGLAQVSFALQNEPDAFSYLRKQTQIYESLLKSEPNNFSVRFDYAQNLSRLVTEGVLDANVSAFKNMIETATAEYETLIQYDTDNQKWRTEYTLALEAILNRARENNFTNIDFNKIESRIIQLKAR